MSARMSIFRASKTQGPKEKEITIVLQESRKKI